MNSTSSRLMRRRKSVISVSSATASSQLRSALQAANHPVLAVEMEGAAVAQTCLDYGIPFAAMRTISDRADDSAHVDFAEFVRTVASRYAQQVMFEFSGVKLGIAKQVFEGRNPRCVG